MEYAKEELKILNMKKVRLEEFNPNSPLVFEIEKEMSIDEKIDFINSQRDNIATYLIELFNKWESEKDSLPKDNYGYTRTVSKKAWLRRNDTRELINKTFDIEQYRLFGTLHKRMGITCPKSEYGREMIYAGEHVAQQWFHDLLEELYREEMEIFKANDPFTIKWRLVKAFGDKYDSVFWTKELNDIIWNSKEVDVEEKNLDIYIEAYQELEKSIASIQEKLNESLGLKDIESE